MLHWIVRREQEQTVSFIYLSLALKTTSPKQWMVSFKHDRSRISFSMLLDEQPKSEVFSFTCLKWNDFREGVVLPCKVELIKVPTCGEAGSCCEDWVRQGVSLSTVPGIWWAIKKCQPRLLLVYEMWKFCYTPSNPSLLSTSRSKSYQQSISIQDHSK